MKRLSSKSQKEALTNALASFCFPSKYFIHAADGRVGVKFSLASKANEYGGIETHTEFMTYDKLNSYLKGFNDAKIGKYQN